MLRAELQAIDEALMRAVEPLVIFTDSLIAMDAFAKGKAYCCAAKSEGAEIWARIWARLDGFGSFRLCKVKAHTTQRDAEEGLISAADQAGNAMADFFAVQARTMAQRAAPVRDFEMHYARARRWYKLAFRAIGCWKEDTLADVEQIAGDKHEQARTEHPGSCTRRHEVWVLPEGLLCRTCGMRFGPSLQPDAVARKRCKGPMRARILDSMGALPDYARVAHTVPELLRAGATPWSNQRNFEEGVVRELAAVPIGPTGEAARAAAPVVPSTKPLRRRLTGKQPDPLDTGRQVVKEYASGHLLTARGRLTYCERCGRWALDKISTALTKRCAGNVDTVKGSYRVRRERMRAGRHPLTNVPL